MSLAWKHASGLKKLSRRNTFGSSSFQESLLLLKDHGQRQTGKKLLALPGIFSAILPSKLTGFVSGMLFSSNYVSWKKMRCGTISQNLERFKENQEISTAGRTTRFTTTTRSCSEIQIALTRTGNRLILLKVQIFLYKFKCNSIFRGSKEQRCRKPKC